METVSDNLNIFENFWTGCTWKLQSENRPIQFNTWSRKPSDTVFKTVCSVLPGRFTRFTLNIYSQSEASLQNRNRSFGTSHLSSKLPVSCHFSAMGDRDQFLSTCRDIFNSVMRAIESDRSVDCLSNGLARMDSLAINLNRMTVRFPECSSLLDSVREAMDLIEDMKRYAIYLLIYFYSVLQFWFIQAFGKSPIIRLRRCTGHQVNPLKGNLFVSHHWFKWEGYQPCRDGLLAPVQVSYKEPKRVVRLKMAKHLSHCKDIKIDTIIASIIISGSAWSALIPSGRIFVQKVQNNYITVWHDEYYLCYITGWMTWL